VSDTFEILRINLIRASPINSTTGFCYCCCLIDVISIIMLMIFFIGVGNVHKYLSTDRERRPDIISTT